MHSPARSDRDSSSDIEHRREKLRLIARTAEWIAVISIALVVAYCVRLWFDPDARIAYLREDVPGLSAAPSNGMAVAAFLISLIPVAIFVAAMWQARGLFRLFGGSRIIAPAVPRSLVRLGILVLSAAVSNIIVRTLVVLIMTIGNSPGQQQLIIGIGSNELSLLIVGLLFLAFAIVTQEAQRIEDEVRSFV